jgi:hypothetical protein
MKITNFKYFILYLLFLFSFLRTDAQNTKRFVAIKPVTNAVWLAYKKYDSKAKMYLGARLVKMGKEYLIKGFSAKRYSKFEFLLSPNKKYIVLQTLEAGYFEGEKGKQYHENAFCYIINLKSNSVLEQLQSACGGSWDNNNNWVNNEEVIFTGN